MQLMMECYSNFPTYNIFTKVGQKIKNCDFCFQSSTGDFLISEVVSGIITA